MTLFITVSESSVANNLLRGTFLQKIKTEKSLRIVLIVPERKFQEYSQEFGRDHVFVESMPAIRFSLLERINIFLSRNVLRTGMVQFVQMRQFYDRGGIIPLVIKRIMWYLLGRSLWIQWVVRKLELFIPPPESIRNLFDKYKPDLVFTTVSDYTEMDIPMLREAKRRKIKTIGAMRGWDTFVAHGFMRVVPDKMVLQNQYLIESGMKYQFLKKEILQVVGLPHFDWHWRKDLIIPREEFCKKIGVGPGKKIILFGAMEDYWFPRDHEIAEIFEDLVTRGLISPEVVMLFRPYPGFAGPIEKIKSMSHVIPDMESFSLAHGDTIEMRERGVSHLLSSIVHSEMVVSVASTILLDGVALGKPAISTALEKTSPGYWFSVRRFYTHCTHFEKVFKTGGIRVVNYPEEFAEALNSYLQDPRRDEDKRAVLQRQFIEPYDGKAGERIAEGVLSALRDT